MHYESIIGLEIHVQLSTKSKMFCRCSNSSQNNQPNSNVCPVCLGLPGALPAVNKSAIEYAIKLGLATNCNINQRCVFARKNYFYPDLPKGYQISQFEDPICEHGWVEIEVDGKPKKIGITRIHIEEDAGKLLHQGLDHLSSYIDLNRAGVPLLEVVSEPDIRTPAEAKAYMEKIYSLVTYLNICQGDLEQGNLRCDANVSVRKVGQKEFGTRTETKNLNSFRFVQQAIEYEINRQIDAISDGHKIVQETRLYDSASRHTVSMRLKEESHDYRYFPCPDLPVVSVSTDYIKAVEHSLPELAAAKKERFLTQYQLTADEAGILVKDKDLANYFEAVVKVNNNPKQAANWLLGDFAKALNQQNQSISQTKITPPQLAQLTNLIDSGKISGKMAKDIFIEMFDKGSDPEKIIAKKGLSQISDKKVLQEMVEKILANNPAEVEQYRQGRQRVLGYFVGQIMAQTKGKANPKVVNEILLQKLRS